MGIIGLVVATLVVAGGLLWGGGALRSRGVNGGGVAMIFAGVFVLLGGGLRAAVIASKHARASVGAEAEGPAAPSADDESRTREVCAANSGLSDAWSVRSFCGCVAVGWRDGRGVDPHFVVTAHESGKLVIEGSEPAMQAFESTFATCARPSIAPWIGHECSATCRDRLAGGDERQCESLCNCVARDVGMRDPDAIARQLWRHDNQRGLSPIDQAIDASLARCR